MKLIYCFKFYIIAQLLCLQRLQQCFCWQICQISFMHECAFDLCLSHLFPRICFICRFQGSTSPRKFVINVFKDFSSFEMEENSNSLKSYDLLFSSLPIITLCGGNVDLFRLLNTYNKMFGIEQLIPNGHSVVEL